MWHKDKARDSSKVAQKTEGRTVAGPALLSSINRS